MNFLKRNQRAIIIVFAFFVLALAIILISASFKSRPDLKNQPKIEKENRESRAELINRKGEKWGPLPEGKMTFTASNSKSKIVKFIQGEINPPDVHVGDLQKFKIAVVSPYGIKSVLAKIETDNGVKELELKKTGVLTQSDLIFNPIVVQRDKVLGMADFSKFEKKETSSLMAVAVASEGESEIFEGEWVVQDTHNIYYHTTFTATDNNNNSNELTLAWSDLCGINNNESDGFELSMPCTLSAGQIEGIDNGNLSVATGSTLTLNGGVFAFNPGKTVLLSGGSIVFSGGSLEKKYMYIEDKDNDGYAKNGGEIVLKDTATATTTGVNGLARRRFTVSGTDCYDDNANVHPGQTAYFATNRGDGSFDYNCDGSSNYEGLGCASREALCTESELTSYKILDVNGDDGSIPYNGSTCTYDVPANNQPAICGVNNWQHTIANNKEYPKCTDLEGQSHYFIESTIEEIVKCH